MFRWMLLRMMLLLWMTRETLQGGTGYKPQNPNGGAAQMSTRGYPVNKGTGAYGNAQNKPGYGGHPQYGGTGKGMMNQHALKQRGGYGNGNGYRAPSYGGYSNLMGAHPQKGVGLGFGAGPAAAKGQGSKSGGYGISAGYPNGGATKAQQGYGGYANGGAAKQPNTGSSLQNMGYPSGGTKGPKPGYGAKAGASNGQGAKPNGYGGYPNGGAAKQPNTGSYLQNMGYPNGGTKGPKPAYGAKAGSSNGQGAMPNGYGTKAGPSNGQEANPNGSSLQNMGYPNGGIKGPKPGYGAKAGPSNGQKAKPNASFLQNMGYPNGGTKGSKPGSSPQNMGYPNGGTKGPQPGYGAKAGPLNAQGARPNGYGGYPNGGAARQPNTGSFQNMGYPNGGTKGPKPGKLFCVCTAYSISFFIVLFLSFESYVCWVCFKGYGAKAGFSNGQGAKPNGYGGYPNGGAGSQPNTGSSPQYMGYPNGGTKGPKAGYGAKAGPTNGQGAKPNGYGVPQHISEGPYKAANSGYMPVTTGKADVSNGKGPKGEILSPEAPSRLPVTSSTKGVLPPAEREPNTGLLPEQTKYLPPVLQQTKGQNLNAQLQQVKTPNSMAPQLAPKPFMQGPGFYKPSKAYKPPTPLIPQYKAQKPDVPAVPQAIPAPESAPIPQTNSPQTLQTVALEQEQVLSQEQTITPVVPQPITPQGSISSQVPLLPKTPEMQQSKIQSNPALPQMKNPSTTNPELTGQGQVQGAMPSKPDCGPGGRPNGQWVKLPSPGTGYPKGKGEVSSQPGFGAGIGGYPAQGMKNGYKAGYGGYGNKFTNPAGQGGQPLGFGSKGKSQAKYVFITTVLFCQELVDFRLVVPPVDIKPTPLENMACYLLHTVKMVNTMEPNPTILNKPLLPESVAKSPDFGGLPYNSQPLGYGGDKSSGKYGQKGLNYGGQPFDRRPDAMPGKYGSPESLYNPESVSLSGNAKSAKYGNPAVSYELLGPVTDGQSVEENRSLEALHQGPEIDGQKSIDQFGTGDYTNGRVQPEVVSFPGVPTVGPAPHIPAVTSFDTTLDGSSLAPVSVPDVSTVSEVSASPVFPQPELPSLKQQPAPPHQIQIQQHLKFHFLPQGNSQTGKMLIDTHL
ncbi:Ribosome-binding protein 1 [Labeo rohita]|uniref:Ribosome-binding protein 1 n=1 Tax=Labeo rohita TaxID=84645 RepID=A0ABQ8M7W5_LABRO|nr:Ribosome-binding protein 1 [Labeo rohita]